MMLTEDDRRRCFEFAKAVVDGGQSGQNYHSQVQRDRLRQIADTWRGKSVEVELARLLWLDPEEVIDWETGKGEKGFTGDGGIDLRFKNQPISVNAIAPWCQYLLIPVYKFDSHKKAGVKWLALGESMGKPKDNQWTAEALREMVHSCNVSIIGVMSLEEFDREKELFPKGGERLNLDADNYGVHRDKLHTFLQIRGMFL